jgi:hypothetical protein
MDAVRPMILPAIFAAHAGASPGWPNDAKKVDLGHVMLWSLLISPTMINPAHCRGSIQNGRGRQIWGSFVWARADLHVLFGAGQVGCLVARRLLYARPYLRSREPTLCLAYSFHWKK